MARALNDVEWKTFLLSKLFKVSGSKTTPKSTLEKIGAGVYPYVTTQTTTNGQAGYFKIFTEQGNVLTVDSAVAGFCTFQAKNFSASDHVEVLKPLFKMNKYIALFLTVQINKNNQEKFSYGYKACQDRLREMSIMLPVNAKGEPDYEFMEEYIKEQEKNLRQKYREYIVKTINKSCKRVELNREWKEFYISDIFDIKSGKRLIKARMKNGKIPFIGATDNGNGITNYISNINSSLDKNVLGVNYDGNGVAISFYHPYSCLFTDSVKRFHLKNYKDNKYVLLFMKSVILKQKNKYMYGYKFCESRMLRQKIMLPVNSKGEPDYELMEDYMKYLEQKKLLEYLEYIE